MRCSIAKLAGLAALAVTSVSAAWDFTDGTVSVQTKGAGVGSGVKEALSSTSVLTSALSFGSADTVKVTITTVDDKTPKRPHQVFLTLRDPVTGLEDSFPFTVKESGKARVELTHKDLPFQFLSSSGPIQAKVVLASFGASEPKSQPVFTLDVVHTAAGPLTLPEPPLRYGKLAEIHHIFRSDPQSPPLALSSLFTLLVIGTLPVLLVGWLLLGANVTHLSKALGAAPISHVLFFGSIASIEGVFFLYYTSWNLFQTLPVASALGVVAILSGSKALTEVQERRLGGLR